MIRGVGSWTGVAGGTEAGGLASRGLGRDAFLAMLVAELRNQNPLEPLKNENFLMQLATFDTLDQMHQVKEAVTELARVQLAAQGAALVGRSVEASTEQGAVIGVVEEVGFGGGDLYLLVGGQWVPLAAVTRVW